MKADILASERRIHDSGSAIQRIETLIPPGKSVREASIWVAHEMITGILGSVQGTSLIAVDIIWSDKIFRIGPHIPINRQPESDLQSIPSSSRAAAGGRLIGFFDN